MKEQTQKLCNFTKIILVCKQVEPVFDWGLSDSLSHYALTTVHVAHEFIVLH